MSGPNQGLEPFDGPALTEFLTKQIGAVPLRRQRGSHLYFKLPNEKMVGSLIHGAIPSSMARITARQIGITYAELRQMIGHPIVSAGRPKVTPRRRPIDHTSTKRHVLAVIAETTGDLMSMADVLRPGQRDPVFYADAFAEISEARTIIRHALDRMNQRKVS